MATREELTRSWTDRPHWAVSTAGPPEPWRQAPAWDGPVPAWPDAGPAAPSWWWLAAHGGAGVTALTSAITGSGDARRAWPSSPDQTRDVVVVCRTHREGLDRAQSLARQYAAGQAPPGVRLLGLVTVADAPGREPATVRRLRRLVTAGYPKHWHVGWIPEWRARRPDATDAAHPDVSTLGRELAELTAEGALS